jgi:probable DNA metabolism protein
MITLLYDGTFAGLLTAIFEIYERRLNNVRVREENNSATNVSSERHTVTTDLAKAARVWRGLHTRITSGMGDNFYACFLSKEKDIENVLVAFARHAFSNEKNIQFDYSDKNTLHVHQLARKVFREKHRMETLMRFQKTDDDVYVSVIEPRYNVLPLMETYVKDTYTDQQWLLYDKQRAYGIYFDPTVPFTSEIVLDFNQNNCAPDIRVHAGELKTQHLWHDLRTVNNVSGKNIKLHVRHVPMRHWRHLMEKPLSKIA